MDHRVAEQTQAVDRYLLNEFTPEERSAFEEHLFDCPICGERVSQGAIAIDNLRAVFEHDRAKQLSEASRLPRNTGWLGWFRTPALIPSVAALALAAVVTYQSSVTIPALVRPQVLSNIAIAPVARESAPLVEVDRARQFFNINFDVAAPQVFPGYVCDFENDSGKRVLTVNAGAQPVASFTLPLLLPTRDFPPGRYIMILRSTSEPHNEVQRYAFQTH